MTADETTLMTADRKTQMVADHLRKSASAICENLRLSGHQRHGQSTLEYAVFMAVVAAALMAMNVYVRRAIQANLQQVQAQVNAEAVQ